jgi:hypothetical protein
MRDARQPPLPVPPFAISASRQAVVRRMPTLIGLTSLLFSVRGYAQPGGAGPIRRPALRSHEGRRRRRQRASAALVFANLGTRRVVDPPAVVSTSAEFCFGVNSGTPLGVDRAPEGGCRSPQLCRRANVRRCRSRDRAGIRRTAELTAQMDELHERALDRRRRLPRQAKQRRRRPARRYRSPLRAATPSARLLQA